MIPLRPPIRRLPGRPWSLAAACALALALLGCSSVTVRRADTPGLLAAWRESAVGAGQLSPRTLQTLRRYGLEQLHDSSPTEAQSQLHSIAVQEPQPDLLFALAEISYQLGSTAEACGDTEACAFYYLCAGYAYHYLFDGHRDASPFDPRFRLACELYNAGLAKCIRAAQRIGQLDPRQELHLPTPDGQIFTLSVVHHGFCWGPEEFGPLLLCSDYRVVGLANHYRGYGLGVPLIATRSASAPVENRTLRYPREVSVPATAFFRFEGGLAELGARRCGRLELYNPLIIQSVEVCGRTVPLEADLTTPLAYFLAHTDLQNVEYKGFLCADCVVDRQGIYMFEPYQPGKIPVVMVHGLLSSPLTWAPLFNDLRADPLLREHFQFWFVLYPTASPYLATAADLRQALIRLRDELDPQRCDPALDQMVLVGHSMGGLVSRLLTEESGNDFWRLVSERPFEELKGRPESREELRRMFFFERQPCVRRVVFIGTPHHGSRLSPSAPGRLAVRFVHLPQKLMEVAQDVMTANGQEWPGLLLSGFPTSVDLLAPGAASLELLSGRPRPAGVHFHSIIGVAPPTRTVRALALLSGNRCEPTDGVVPYASAHLETAESEVIVPADHFTVHHHPLTVLEVRRILLEHLNEVRGGRERPAPLGNSSPARPAQ